MREIPKIIGIHGATVYTYMVYPYIEKEWSSLEGIPVKVDFLDNGFAVIPQGGEIWRKNLPNGVKASIIRLEVIHNGQREGHSANCHSNGDVRRMQ